MKVINITQKQLNLNLRQHLTYLGEQQAWAPEAFKLYLLVELREEEPLDYCVGIWA